MTPTVATFHQLEVTNVTQLKALNLCTDESQVTYLEDRCTQELLRAHGEEVKRLVPNTLNRVHGITA